MEKINTPNKYMYWDILDEMPDGWVIDKTCGSPAYRTVFITNGKSPLKGQKRALLRIKVNGEENGLRLDGSFNGAKPLL